MASVDFIRTSLDSSISGEVQDVCYNLSDIIGDINGKISRSMARRVSSNIDVIPPGIVVSTELLPSTIPSKDEPIVPLPLFTAEISPSSYNNFSMLTQADESLVIAEGLTSGTIASSPLLQQSSGLSLKLSECVSILYIETYTLYLELLQATASAGLPSLTRQDLSRLEGNIRWFTHELEISARRYDLIGMARDLQRTIAYARYQDFLFTRSYGVKLDEYKSAVGEVDTLG